MVSFYINKLILFLFLIPGILKASDLITISESSLIRKVQVDWARACGSEFKANIDDINNSNCKNIHKLNGVQHQLDEDFREIEKDIHRFFPLEEVDKCREEEIDGRGKTNFYLQTQEFLKCLENQSVKKYPVKSRQWDSPFKDYRNMDALLKKANETLGAINLLKLRCEIADGVASVDEEGRINYSAKENKCYQHKAYDFYNDSFFDNETSPRAKMVSDFLKGRRPKDFERACLEIYLHPQNTRFDTSQLINSAYNACEKMCSGKMKTEFCKEVYKVPEIRNQKNMNESKKFISNSCSKMLFDETAIIGENGLITPFRLKGLSKDTLNQDFLNKQTTMDFCYVQKNILPSLGDLQDIVEGMRIKYTVEPYNWGGDILRSIAVREQLKHHCDVYGGPLPIYTSSCSRFKETITHFTNPDVCPEKKPKSISSDTLKKSIPRVRRLIDDITRLRNEMETAEGPIDGATYYAARFLSFTTSNVTDLKQWYEYLEFNVHALRLELTELMQNEETSGLFAGGDLATLDFPLIDEINLDYADNTEYVNSLQVLAKEKAKVNTGQFLENLCDRNVMSNYDIFKLGKLFDKAKNDYPEYKDFLSCMKKDYKDRDDMLENASLLAGLGCLAASIGPQAVVLAPLCTGLGIAEALARDSFSEDELSIKSYCASNEELCSRDEIVGSIEKRDENRNNKVNELFFAPLIISEFRDISKALKKTSDVAKLSQLDDLRYAQQYLSDPGNFLEAERIKKLIESESDLQKRGEILLEEAKKIRAKEKDAAEALERSLRKKGRRFLPWEEKLSPSQKKALESLPPLPDNPSPAQVRRRLERLKEIEFDSMKRALADESLTGKVLEQLYNFKKSDFKDYKTLASTFGLERLSGVEELLIDALVKKLRKQGVDDDQILKKIKNFLKDRCGR